MARAIAYPCTVGGCPHRQPCPKHGGRGPEQYGYYGTRAWRRLRVAHLQIEPYCRACKMGGRLVLASFVHHIVSRRDGGPDEHPNLMSLCRPHHDKTRGEESIRTSDSFFARREAGGGRKS